MSPTNADNTAPHANAWLTHLRDPAATSVSNDIAHVKAIVSQGTDAYIALEQAVHAMRDVRDYYIGLVEERKRAEKQATPVAQRQVPAVAKTWTCGPPRYIDLRPSRLAGKGCMRRGCDYVHEDQVGMYKDVIADLKWKNRDDECDSIHGVEAGGS